MIRSIASVLAGMIVWAVVWVGANAGLAAAAPQAFAEDGSTSHGGLLVGMLVLSVVDSLLAGWVTALVARRRFLLHTAILGVLQLAIGIAVQLQYWEVMPLWYHLPFLVLLVPGNVAGGWIRSLQVGDSDVG